jgi:hypothetical protein
MKTYLGDGCYVEYTGYSFILTTSNGIFLQNEIHLELKMIQSLNEFVAKMLKPEAK